MEFKLGDVVQLKGGSPIMTITAFGKDPDGKPRATCTWFDTTHNEKTGVYPLEALRIYVAEKGDIYFMNP
jgi:uncharacterized protein YodC (DUF2158 family)